MTATVVTTARRMFGLVRHVYIGRCPTCRWRLECAELPTAVNACRSHRCGEGRG